MDKDDKKLAFDAWKTAVEVQKHFNEIQLKIRQLAVTVVVGTSSAAGWLLKEGYSASLGSTTFSAAAGLFGVTALSMSLFGLMDGLWYHRLLKGAGKYACEQEKLVGPDVMGAGLSNTVTQNSSVKLWGVTLGSTGKLGLFYGATIAIFLVAACVAWAPAKTTAGAVQIPPATSP